MPESAKQHVGSVDVTVDGAALDPRYRELLSEVKVVDSLTLPDMALVRITDLKGENVDGNPLTVGAKLEVKFGGLDAHATTSVFKGQITSVEPEFTPTGVTISARAYDKSHSLNRERKTRTFQNMSASDMVRKIVGEAGLAAKVESTSVVHEFFQQSNETDWDFAWRLALMHDYEVVVTDETLSFRKAGGNGGGALTLRWGETLHTYRPRVSGIQQVDTVEVRGWDPKTKHVITGSASSPQTSSKAGVSRSQVAGGLNGGTTAVKDRAMTSMDEANEIAKATLQRTADAHYEADGVATGNPQLKAGTRVKIDGVGNKFGGEFTISTSTHSYRGHSGYQTAFTISGRSSRTLTELIRQPAARDWSANLVVGVVTNNNDPEQRGRVRVKYPSLSDSEESAWAPVATPSTGNGRGFLMLPQTDEEVIVGFEHGDSRRPIVLGSTFNGRDKPGDELYQLRDGSLAVVSNEKIHLHSKEDFEITSDHDMTVQIDGYETVTVGGDSSHQSRNNDMKANQSFTVQAGQSMTVKGMHVTVEASGSLTLKGLMVDIQGTTGVNIKGAMINLG
jgi:phage protein D